MSAGAHAYGVEHLATGWRRWAFTRDGVVLSVHRYRKSAEAEAALAADWPVLFDGRESATVDFLVDHLARRGYPMGLATAEEEEAWQAAHA